jgi:hypothetical protein
LAIASVSIGRRRLPPDEIRWLATSGIIVTSEPVRDRIVLLTRSMSDATSSTSRSIDGVEWLYNNRHVRSPDEFKGTIETAVRCGKSNERPLLGLFQPREKAVLRELVRTNDAVLVSAVGALLDGANIHHLVLDSNMSIMDGSLGVPAPHTGS